MSAYVHILKLSIVKTHKPCSWPKLASQPLSSKSITIWLRESAERDNSGPYDDDNISEKVSFFNVLVSQI